MLGNSSNAAKWRSIPHGDGGEATAPIIEFIAREIKRNPFLSVKQQAIAQFSFTAYTQHKQQIMKIVRSNIPPHLTMQSQEPRGPTRNHPIPRRDQATGFHAPQSGSTRVEGAIPVSETDLRLRGVETTAQTVSNPLLPLKINGHVTGALRQEPQAQASQMQHCSFCHARFTLAGQNRRSFCRNCGDCVCRSSTCSTKTYWALLEPTPQRTCKNCIDALRRDHIDMAGYSDRLPVLIVPGFASSALEVVKSKVKKTWVNKRVWISLDMLLEKLVGVGGGVASVPDGELDDDSADFGPGPNSGKTMSKSNGNENGNGNGNGQAGKRPKGLKRKGSMSKHKNKKKGASGDTFDSGDMQSLSAGRVDPRRPRDSFMQAKDSFGTENKKRWHVLVRHLTLQADGVSDPQGIKVRAAVGLNGVTWLSERFRNLSYVFGPIVEHMEAGLGYVADPSGVSVSVNARPRTRTRTRPSRENGPDAVPSPHGVLVNEMPAVASSQINKWLGSGGGGLGLNKEPFDSNTRVGLGPNVAAMPYDWRISPCHLEERDAYFTSLKQKVEEQFHEGGNRPVVLLSHSMGGKITYYFLRWVLWHELRQIVEASITYVPEKTTPMQQSPVDNFLNASPLAHRQQAGHDNRYQQGPQPDPERVVGSDSHSDLLNPWLRRADLKRALALAHKIGVVIPEVVVAKIRKQDDPRFLQSLAQAPGHNGHSLIAEVFKLNVASVVEALMPKVMELHGGCSSRWARVYVKQFVSMGGPFLGSCKGVRASCDGTAMGLETFFNDTETSQLTHTCAAAAFLYPVARSLHAVNALGAIRSHPESCVDADYQSSSDDGILKQRLLPWYHMNDVTAGGCTVVHDRVMEEVYRLVSSRRLVKNGEEIVAANEAAATAAAGSGVGMGINLNASGRLGTNGNAGVSNTGRKYSFSSQGILPSESNVVTAGNGIQHRVLSFSQLATIITKMFGRGAYLNRQTKIRTIFDEYLKQSKKLPSVLPVFLVRNESVLRFTVSNIWLQKTFQSIVKPRMNAVKRAVHDWFVVLVLRYLPHTSKGKAPSREKAKSAPTRVQSVDEFTRSKFMKRVHDIMMENAVHSEKALNLASLKAELLKTFSSAVYQRLEGHLEAFLHHVSLSAKPFHAFTAHQGRAASARLPLNADESTFAGINIAMEVGTDVTDFLQSRTVWHGSGGSSKGGHGATTGAKGKKEKEKESDVAKDEQAYGLLRKAQVQLELFAFSDEASAKSFSSTNNDNVGKGVRVAEASVGLAQLMDIQAKAQAMAYGHHTPEVVDLFNGWVSMPHHQDFPDKDGLNDELDGVLDAMRRGSHLSNQDLTSMFASPGGKGPARRVSDFVPLLIHVVRIQRYLRHALRQRQRRAMRVIFSTSSGPDDVTRGRAMTSNGLLSAGGIVSNDGDPVSTACVHNVAETATAGLSRSRRGTLVNNPQRIFGAHGNKMKGDLTVKMGSAKYTTPPNANAALHLQIQWRRHAFKVPSATRVCPDLDYGTAVSDSSNPLGMLLRHVDRSGKRSHRRSRSGRLVVAATASTTDSDTNRNPRSFAAAMHTRSSQKVHEGSGIRLLSGSSRTQINSNNHTVHNTNDSSVRKRSDVLTRRSLRRHIANGIPEYILRSSFGPHFLGVGYAAKASKQKLAKQKQLSYIGVPCSAVLKCQGAEDNVSFWDYYKQDPLLYDEATKVEGHCFTCPPACDSMLQLYGTGIDTERHAFYKRRRCIRTTDSKHTALEPDLDATMESMPVSKGIAYETVDTKQVQCDTGDLVEQCGDGTVHYQSLRFPALWRRSRIWRRQRRLMLNAHLSGVLYRPQDIIDPDCERACDVRLKEFEGIEHRAMLQAPEVLDTLTSILNPTLQIHVSKLLNFWPKIEESKNPGRKLKSLAAYWELSLLPKDVKSESSKHTTVTTERLLYGNSEFQHVPKDKHHVIRSSSPVNGQSRDSVDEEDAVVCTWDESVHFDASLDLSAFVGICCKLRFQHNNKIHAFFILSSAQVNQHSGTRLAVNLTDGRGRVEIECRLHRSGEYGGEGNVAAVGDGIERGDERRRKGGAAGDDTPPPNGGSHPNTITTSAGVSRGGPHNADRSDSRHRNPNQSGGVAAF